VKVRTDTAEQVVEEVRSEVVVAGDIVDQVEWECQQTVEGEEGIGWIEEVEEGIGRIVGTEECRRQEQEWKVVEVERTRVEKWQEG
jgi:hypothetical protein